MELGILASVMGCGPVPEDMGQCQGVWADTMEGGPVPPAGTSRAGWGRFWGSTDGFGMGLGKDGRFAVMPLPGEGWL